jgi:hypothetical protein
MFIEVKKIKKRTGSRAGHVKEGQIGDYVFDAGFKSEFKKNVEKCEGDSKV